jgi:multiple antibiotic resistance protein
MADAGSPANQGWVIAAVISVLLVTLAAGLLASQIRKIVGKTGDDIIQRLLGVILAALAIQFVANGANGLF